MNNQAFELKDAYLADFENKLDAYNKKGKGIFWFLFGGMVLFTCFYDFAILPKHNKKQTYSIAKVIPFHKVESDISTSAIQITNSSADITDNSVNDRIINSRNTKNTLETTNTVSGNKILKHKTSLNNIALQSNKNTDSQNSTNSDKTILNSDIEHTTVDSIDENKNLSDSTAILPTLKEEQKPEVIYLDDTIRRKVVVIDTVVQRDTVVINDTIKNRIRLFKKKR